MSAWLSVIDGDSMLTESARELAKVLVEDFGAEASGYAVGHDRDFAEVMRVSVRTAAEARRELISRGFLTALKGRYGEPSFRLSTCRW